MRTTRSRLETNLNRFALRDSQSDVRPRICVGATSNTISGEVPMKNERNAHDWAQGLGGGEETFVAVTASILILLILCLPIVLILR